MNVSVKRNINKYDFISVSHYFYPRVGGLENMAFNLISGLQKKGLNCIAIYGGSNRTSTTINGFKAESFPTMNIFNGTYPIFGLDFVTYVYKLLVQNPNAKVIIHSRHLASSLITAILCVLTRHQYDVVEHNAGHAYFKSPQISKLARWTDRNIFGLVHKFATKSITVSYASRKWVSKTFGISNNYIDTIYNGFNTKEIKNNFAKKENIIVWAAKWIEVKDPSTTLRAYKKIADKYPDWKFVLIGKGNSLKKYKNLPENIKIIPEFIKQEELFRLLRKSKIYVNSSLSEGFALGILEASAFGNIPVVSSAPSNKELANEINTTKYVFKRNNSVDLANKLETAIEKSNDMKFLKTLAKTTKERFANQTMINKYYAYLYPNHLAAENIRTLSIVIPAYNEEKSILGLLNKIIEVHLPNDIKKEIVIVNDYSEDNTEELIKNFINQNKSLANFKLLTNIRNLGKSQTVKHGILHTTGDLVVIQDADLEYDPNDFIKFVKTFTEHPETDVIYGNRFNENNKFISVTHYLGNKFITAVSNLFTGTKGFAPKDMETCYKMAKGDLFRELMSTLESTTNFGLEPEMTAKFANYRKVSGDRLSLKQLDIYYKPRSEAEGKKMRWFKHGFEAIQEITRFNVSKKSNLTYDNTNILWK